MAEPDNGQFDHSNSSSWTVEADDGEPITLTRPDRPGQTKTACLACHLKTAVKILVELAAAYAAGYAIGTVIAYILNGRNRP